MSGKGGFSIRIRGFWMVGRNKKKEGKGCLCWWFLGREGGEYGNLWGGMG